MLKSIRPSQAWFVIGFFVALLYVFVPWLHDGPLFTAISASAIVAILIGIRWTRKELRLPWYLLALGQLMFTLGDAIVYLYPDFTGKELPFPAISDVFYLAMYPFVLMAGVLLLERVPPERKSLNDWMIFVGTALATGTAMISPFIMGEKVIPSLTLLVIAYPILDLVFFSLIAQCFLKPSPPTYFILMAGIGALLIVDTIYAVGITINANFDPTGSVLDIGWIAYYICLGAAAITKNGERPFVPVIHKGMGFKEWLKPGAWEDAYEG